MTHPGGAVAVPAPGWRVFAPAVTATVVDGVETRPDPHTGRALRAALRAAASWAGARVSGRPAPAPETLLLPGLGAEPDLWGPLAVVALLAATPEDEVDIARLVHALGRIARWASEQGAHRLAFAFARTAAEAAPALSSSARLAGIILLRGGDPDGAEAWLTEALTRAARLRDRESQRLAAEAIAEMDEVRFPWKARRER